MIPILVLHGPNLNLLGEREPGIYGGDSMEQINQRLIVEGEKIGVEIKCFQSNSEGELIDRIQDARLWSRGVIINPGGYTHTSIAIRDAISSLSIPVVEVHLSNIYARESFRKDSFISPVCVGTIAGFGWWSYLLGLTALASIIDNGTQ